MKFLDLGVYIIIAICYNLFIHHITSMLYKEYPYDEKYDKSLTFIFIAGIATIIIAKLGLKKQVVSKGLTLGGSLLVLTAIIVNWNNMTDEIKLCLSAVGFGVILWYFHNYYDKSDVKKIKHNKVENYEDNDNYQDELLNIES